jgi:serine-type D-Ala-D-Ala carboxypeptidase/endopeptidase (penicillin-binding protein 4)
MKTTPIFVKLFAIFSLFGCATLRKPTLTQSEKLAQNIEQSPVFSRAFTGFVLADPNNGQVLCNVKGDLFYTPASNTKIQTLYACLRILGDSIPGLQYYTNQDFLVLRGTGDPTLGHPRFKQWQQNLEFLKKNNKKTLQINQNNWHENALGPGWFWDDLTEAYSPERSAMPFHGNVFNVSAKGKNNDLTVEPPGFEWTNVETPSEEYDVKLLMEEGTHLIQKGKKAYKMGYSINIPIKNVEANSFPLFLKAIGNPPIDIEGLAPTPNESDWKTLKSCPVDTVYRLMMHQSDNLIAEQLLLVCAGVKSGALKESTVIKYCIDSLFANFPQKPNWVDGSGLSRYNLNTPHNYIELLRKLWEEQPRERLFNLFPAGGFSGTLKNWYGSNKPYIFAKSGSMSGVYCLSGYIVCQSGKVLSFSFMHNNIPATANTDDWKMEMQHVFEKIRMEY